MGIAAFAAAGTGSAASLGAADGAPEFLLVLGFVAVGLVLLAVAARLLARLRARACAALYTSARR